MCDNFINNYSNRDECVVGEREQMEEEREREQRMQETEAFLIKRKFMLVLQCEESWRIMSV